MIKKNIDLIIVAFIMLSILMYEATLEILGELMHLIFEVLHTMFEWVELGVEGVVERLFHLMHIGGTIEFLFSTERHGGQVVTFYILMTFIGMGLYRLSKFLPQFYEFVKQQFLVSWIRRKTQVRLFWHSLTELHKAAAIAAFIGFVFVASFLVI